MSIKNSETNSSVEMKTDLTNAVKKYKKTSIYDAINEAIVNSIQAGATEIKVNIVSNNESDLFGRQYVASVSVEDNGDGFNADNRKSFLTYLISHKQKEHGCQGVGRLSYLKSFKTANVSSKQNNQLVEFDFTTELNDEKLEPKPIKDDTKKTIITLNEPRANTSYDLDKASQEIYNHMYPFLFLRKKDCEITINNDRKITRDDVKNIQALNFKVTKKTSDQEESIDLTLFYRFSQSEKTILDDFLCINSRPMKRFSNKPLKMKLNEKEGYQITLLLESDWINKQSNQFHDIEIEEDEEDGQQESTFILWSDVKKELVKEVNKLLNKQFPELEKENAKKINDLKEKYPHYADYIENSSIGFVDEKQILDNAYKQARTEEQRLESKNTSIEDVKRCVSNDLIRYILHRQKIIEKLQELKNTEIEKEVHNLFLEQGLEGVDERQVPLDKNNLWLLDDKFMSYT